ncbi:hypothetical protein RFI_22899 [Reticulomyxa filosa]|uniref:Uncharacterized protein n=1 Tax=Reticulomyxa filosa TaxID=46433 RepID=X6MN12_RETFI|nr:hypothetical protein RFI_22899 [Reticulomyxa filosa]|eukprot:ETO14470.1 hypothetical protein RFI_22899 [Reticulomyxa filosa]
MANDMPENWGFLQDEVTAVCFASTLAIPQNVHSIFKTKKEKKICVSWHFGHQQPKILFSHFLSVKEKRHRIRKYERFADKLLNKYFGV